MTFDEQRSRITICGCGQHGWTGSSHGLGCAWARWRRGRFGAVWAQPDRQSGAE
jgi:hypothetical protein